MPDKDENTANSFRRSSLLDLTESSIGRASTEHVSGGDPTVRVSSELVVRQAIRNKARTIRIDQLETEVLIRHPINGVMTDVMTLANIDAIPIIARFKSLAGLDVTEQRISQVGCIRIRHGGTQYDLPVHCEPTEFGECLLMWFANQSMLRLAE